MRAPRPHRKAVAAEENAGAVFVRLAKSLLVQPDTRSHAEFLHDMRAKQAAGGLNPATAALLDRLQRAI